MIAQMVSWQLYYYPNQLPVLVDGSKTPGQIPDNLAYQHFFAAISAHPSPTAQELARQNAQLLPLNLSATDRKNLVQGMPGRS